MDETAIYQANDLSGSGPDQPTGNDPMPNANPAPQAQGRYTFCSGSRPLDGYTIKRAIGRGGFGEVYYATSDAGKEVALKLILRNLDVERRGVSQCMNLKCPNLLAIHDLKTNDAGDAFVIMEYVAGPSLASVLKQYPEGLPQSEVRHWLKGLVEGVAYLHDHGIVHRDLKPANLFMEEGIVKIGDYGLAKLITPSHGSEHSESIGTCHYMAPEIGSGKYHKPIDVYAIGVILYEMLTGHVPFDGETVNEVLMKHLTTRPDVTMLPEPYRSIVNRALAKDPNQRPARVYDLLPPEDAPGPPRCGSSARGSSRWWAVEARALSATAPRGRRPSRTTSCGSVRKSPSSTSARRRSLPCAGRRSRSGSGPTGRRSASRRPTSGPHRAPVRRAPRSGPRHGPGPRRAVPPCRLRPRAAPRLPRRLRKPRLSRAPASALRSWRPPWCGRLRSWLSCSCP